MAGLLEPLRSRVEQTRRELEEAKVVTARARAREEMLTAELAAYERALSAEERREGGVLQTQPPPTVPPHADDEGEINKTDFVEAYIARQNGHGVTPPEAYRAFLQAGINIHRNYVYSILSRLVAKGKVKERRGKYFKSDDNREASELKF
jgi:hypothetical protein